MASEKDNQSSDVKAPDLYESRRLFGLRLKELREQQGMTPAEVAEKTRVNSEFIAAIETGDFDRLPGRLFARGFVSAILKLCAVGDDKLISEFDALWTDDGIRQAISQTTKMRLAGKKQGLGSVGGSGSPVRRAAGFLFVAVVGVALTGAAWFGYTKGKSHFARFLGKYTKSAPTEVQSEPDSAASGKHPQKAEGASVSPPAPGGSDARESEIQAVQSAGNAVATDGAQSITISVLEPVKIKIESDDQKPVVKDFAVGTYKFAFKESSDLLVYDAAAVRISFNGNPIGSLGTKGRVRRIGFRANGPDKTAF